MREFEHIVLMNKIRSTKEKIKGLQMERFLSDDHRDKVEIGARILLWESQLRVLKSQLPANEAAFV